MRILLSVLLIHIAVPAIWAQGIPASPVCLAGTCGCTPPFAVEADADLQAECCGEETAARAKGSGTCCRPQSRSTSHHLPPAVPANSVPFSGVGIPALIDQSILSDHLSGLLRGSPEPAPIQSAKTPIYLRLLTILC